MSAGLDASTTTKNTGTCRTSRVVNFSDQQQQTTSTSSSSIESSSDIVQIGYLSSSTGTTATLPSIPDPPGGVASSTTSNISKKTVKLATSSPQASPLSRRRVRAHSMEQQQQQEGNGGGGIPTLPPASPRGGNNSRRNLLSLHHDNVAKAKARDAQRINDSMVYLDGPQVYTCAQCRTHLTSHDEIISKSFHGRHGRAYLFDQCVNVTFGPVEERRLITGLHTVCDIFCKRCKTLVGWTYQKAYEASQKYKEGKYIIEKINLHLEVSDYYTVAPPAGERSDRWRKRSMSWGDESSQDNNNNNRSHNNNNDSSSSSMVFEYRPSSP